MGFERTVPRSQNELHQYLVKIHQNRGHVKSVIVNMRESRIEIDLDGMANFGGYPDVYIPVKRDQLTRAKTVIERVLKQSEMGFLPSEGDAKEIFDMVDPAGK